MKYLAPLLIAFVLFSCKKKEEESVYEPVAGLTAITTLSQINSEVASGVSMIFFHASWCSICQAQRPAVSEVAVDTDLDVVFFGEVEYDDHTDIVEAYNVDGFPTIVIFKDGAEVNRILGGGHTAEEIKMAIQEQL